MAAPSCRGHGRFAGLLRGFQLGALAAVRIDGGTARNDGSEWLMMVDADLSFIMV